MKDLRSRCPVILVTGFGTLDSAVEAAREGAWDFISKPFKVEEVVATARRALEQVEKRTAEAGKQSNSLRHMSGSALYRAVSAMIELYS